MIVLEAGMGGASDEVSLFSPTVLAIARIFGEHLGQLGDTPTEIAEDKADATTAHTSAVVSLPPEKSVEDALNRTVSVRSNNQARIEFVAVLPPSACWRCEITARPQAITCPGCCPR